ncbi:MAG: hypothetical protein UH241_04760 [Acutalibacteraceae bacterium]|nr:hypothetical protein [Acutalibacteraceae bacterium]
MARISDTKDTAEISAVFTNLGFQAGLSRWYGEEISFVCEGDSIAYRTKNKTHLNLFNEITNSYTYLSTRKLSLYGFLGHEDGHKLYTDYDLSIKNCEKMQNENEFAFDTSNLLSEENFNEMKANCNRKSFLEIFHNIINIIEDIYVEFRILIDENTRNKYGVGLVMNNNRMSLLRRYSVEQELSFLTENKKPVLYAILNALIEYKCSEQIDWGNKENISNEIISAIYGCIDILEDCCYNYSFAKRLEGATKICCLLWDYINEALPEQEDDDDENTNPSLGFGEGNITSSSANIPCELTKEEAKRLLEQSKKSIEENINNNSSSTLAKQLESCGTGGKSLTEQSENAQLKHKEEQKHKIDAELIGTQRLNLNNANLHSGVDVIVEYPRSDKTAYEIMKLQLNSTIRKMANALNNIQDKKCKQKNYHYTGKKFVARRAYKTDLKVFSQDQIPEKSNHFHLELLIDNSGSMSGKNIEISKQTACLFYEATKSINGCSITVSAHTTKDNSCVISRLVVNDDTPYRISSLFGENSNRDGLALDVIYKTMMSKLPQDTTKLFIYINDGQPAHSNYSGYDEAVKNELNGFAKQCERENVIFLVAGIDGDKERLEELYGAKHFLNINDLEKLPQILSRVLLNVME